MSTTSSTTSESEQPQMKDDPPKSETSESSKEEIELASMKGGEEQKKEEEEDDPLDEEEKPSWIKQKLKRLDDLWRQYSPLSSEPWYYGDKRTVYVNSREQNKSQKFIGNGISTAKYNAITFLPKNLFEQFRRVANFYFLVIAMIQLIPGISPINPASSILPLVFVLGVTAIKEAFEDVKRRKSDRDINHKKVLVLEDANHTKDYDFVTRRWEDIKVGDIVKIVEKESFPADIVVLNTSLNEGLCFISTANLDGETNLKERQALKETLDLNSPAEYGNLVAAVSAPHPSDQIHKFDGAMDIDGHSTLGLTLKNTCFRGCVLEDTEWVVGTVIYTGKDTKVSQNSSDPPSKRSHVELKMNSIIYQMFGFLSIWVLIASIIGTALETDFLDTHTYLILPDQNGFVLWISNFATFLILFSVLIPISLYVSIEIVKVAQAVFMNKDIEMYHEASDTPAKVKTTNLTEELGQISHVFSDKTGTLTRNQMDFMQCSINGISYGELKEEDDPIFNDAECLAALKDESHEQYKPVKLFWQCLATCHTVIPDLSDPEEPVWKATSPDEQALARAARDAGFFFHTRNSNSLTVKELGKDVEWKLLNINEFNSDRKRMSVVVQDPDDNLFLFCKGADSFVYALLGQGQEELKDKTNEHLTDFAKSGLRTLTLAYKPLSKQEYDDWNEKYYQASIALDNREEELAKVALLIEKDLILLGATAIEDKLQIGVPETIAHLAEAGVKVWVLTGDKTETAINIGFSCRLLTDEQTLLIVNGETRKSAYKDLQAKINQQAKEPEAEFALIIDGKTLEHLLRAEYKYDLLSCATKCKAVICCRVAPIQKAQVVKLVRKNIKTAVTLAIGDGANDVSMIQAAHVGIGISGFEGRQAVQVSDYAIAQFRYLERLMLLHGHWNYKRITTLIVYSFYKNCVFALTQFWFMAFCAFSGQTLYDSYSISVYNVIFTGLPILIVGTFDKDVGELVLLKYPPLYQNGVQNASLNAARHWTWILNGVYQSIIIFFLSVAAFRVGNLHTDGTIFGQWSLGILVFTSVIFSVNLKVALETRYWTVFNHIATWGSMIAWFVWLAVYSTIETTNLLFPVLDLFFVWFRLTETATYWFTIVLIPVIALLPDFIIQYIRIVYYPKNADIIREVQTQIKLENKKKKKKKAEQEQTPSKFSRQRRGFDNSKYFKSGFAFSEESGRRQTLLSFFGKPRKSNSIPKNNPEVQLTTSSKKPSSSESSEN